MASRHALIIAALFALAAIAGGAALGRTLNLSAASKRANDKVIVSRTRQLNRFEQSLHRQLANAPQDPAMARTTEPHVQRVVYVRPKPIVIHKHRAGGESAAERDHADGSFDD